MLFSLLGWFSRILGQHVFSCEAVYFRGKSAKRGLFLLSWIRVMIMLWVHCEAGITHKY